MNNSNVKALPTEDRFTFGIWRPMNHNESPVTGKVYLVRNDLGDEGLCKDFGWNHRWSLYNRKIIEWLQPESEL